LQGNYDGPSEFVREKLEKETALDIEERIKRAESKEKEAKEKRKRLERIKREREEQSALRDKKELLQEKQDKLRELADKDPISREDAERQALQQLNQRSTFEKMGDEEVKETRAFDKKVDSLTADQNKDELVEDVQRLQKQVADLNGGPEDYFMDLQQSDMEVQSV